MRFVILVLGLLAVLTTAGFAAINVGATNPGATIAFGTRGTHGATDVFLLDTRTRLPHNITRTPVNEMPIAWSPDGTTLAFHRTDGHPSGTQLALWSFEAGVSILPRMTGYRFPAWSPDGENILITIRRYDESAEYANEYTNIAYALPLDGSDPRQLDADAPLASDYLRTVNRLLTDNFASLQSPFDRLHLSIDQDENGHYWLVRVDSGRTHPLVEISANAAQFGLGLVWVDQRQVVYMDRGALWTLDIFDGTIHMLYRGEFTGLAQYTVP